MKHLALGTLLPFVVLFLLSGVSSTSDGTADDENDEPEVEQEEGGTSAQDETYSEEAKAVQEVIDQLAQDVDDQFNQDAEALLKDNILLDSLNKYKAAYKKAEGSNCQGEAPPNIDEYMDKQLRNCDSALPNENLEIYMNNLKAADTYVLTIDRSIKFIDDTCLNHACDNIRKASLVQLGNVFNENVQNAFREHLSDIDAEFKPRLQDCFDKKVAEKKSQLDAATASLESCIQQ